MLAYITRRVLLLPLTLLGLSIIVFSMSGLLSPQERLMAFIDNPLQMSGGQEAIDQMLEKHGLLKPLPVQYWGWLKGILKGNFGWSSTAQLPVLEALLLRIPATLEIMILSVVPIIFGGITMGVLSAAFHNRSLDHITRLVAISGWSMPSFLLALIILMIFYGQFDLFMPGRLSQWAARIVTSPDFVRYTGMNIFDGLLNGRFDIALDAVRHVIMPAMTLTLVDWAALARITRSSMIESLHTEYVRTARAKGLKERVVIFRHALRNALLPAVTFGGMLFAWMLAGFVIAETIFNYPGVGKFAADAARHLDFAAILGFAMFFGTLMLTMNLIVDVLYAFLDPRVRLD